MRRARDLGLAERRSDGTYAPSEVEAAGGHTQPFPAFDVFARLWRHVRGSADPTEFDGDLAAGVDWREVPARTGIALRSVRDTSRAREELVARWEEASARRAVVWFAPDEDGLADRLRKGSVSVDVLRDELGLPHFKPQCRVVVLRWSSGDLMGARRPTMLDARWEYYRPAPRSASWGRTLHLGTGGPGRREAVFRALGALPARALLRDAGGRLWTRTVTRDLGPDCDLCARLLAAPSALPGPAW